MSKEKRVLLAPFETGSGLKKALNSAPASVISVIEQSGLRGRGGAGFPTGLKWKFAANNTAERKFVICNADEGEPGTFKDRELLLHYPEKLLEGMTICAWATGATEGFIYLRAEYEFMRKELEQKIEQFRKDGMLGKNIFNSSFSFNISIRTGAGAYVCGEEFALITSMNGHRGEPRSKPPFPAEQGYLNEPTVVNNVETLCYIPLIIAQGAEWFSAMGIPGSEGTKLFSVSGDVPKPGVYEFELGITVAELLTEVGATDAKAVQVGGYSGTMVAAQDFNKQIHFQALPPGGSTIVFGQERDIVEIAKHFMHFFVDESCGKCTPCRLGTKRLYEMLDRILSGTGKEADLELMEKLGNIMKETSLCGLGQTAPNPVLSTLHSFRHEYMDHITNNNV